MIIGISVQLQMTRNANSSSQ